MVEALFAGFDPDAPPVDGGTSAAASEEPVAQEAPALPTGQGDAAGEGAGPRRDEDDDSSSSDSDAGQQSADSAAEHMAQVIQEQEEKPGAKRAVYMITISRVLPETLQATGLRDVTKMSRGEVQECVRDAFDNPMTTPSGGAPRTRDAGIVDKIVVFREAHSSGEIHFHVAVKFKGKESRVWCPAKRTLRSRHNMPSHFSCTHQWWSAVRYGHVPSPKKPTVDPDPLVWTHDGRTIDLYAESQEPWLARAWKARREAHECESARKGKGAKFNKTDLTSLILTERLFTKAAIMRYAKQHGTAAMVTFVNGHIRQLKEYIEDALEWDGAEDAEFRENETDWALLCRTADGQCALGDSACGYRSAAMEIFQHNSSNFDWRVLAKALRSIIINGPAKEVPVPMLVGSTNSGKSTICIPFDWLFGFKHVLHKPAKNSGFGLRNITKSKRFIFWDDYRPVEYAMLPKQAVPVDTFLSLFQGLPFEVQASQSFNDGNIDWSWKRGAVITAKEKELWAPRSGVTEEDVKHMRSRVREFRFSTIPEGSRRGVQPCPCCMARWIRDGAAAADAAPALAPWPQATTAPQGAGGAAGSGAPPAGCHAASAQEPVLGFAALMQKAAIPPEIAHALQQEAVALGAIDAREFMAADWQSLSAWSMLRPFQARRLLCLVS